MNVEILGERVSAGRYGFIVRDKGGIIQSVQVYPFHHRTTRHVVFLIIRMASSRVQALVELNDLSD